MASSGIQWPLIIVLFGTAALNYGDRTAVSAVLPLLRKDLGMSDLALGSIGTLFLWAYAAGSPFAGRIADRKSRSKLVVYSLAAWSLVMVLSGFVNTSGQLLFTRVLLGLAECLYLPAALALIADHHPPQTRATAMGIHLAGLNSGLIFGGLLAGWLGDNFGWRPSFFILGGAGLVLAVAALRILRDGPHAAASEPAPPLGEALSRLMGTRSYVVVMLQAMIVATGTWMFFNWLPLYYQEAFKMSLAGAGFSGTFMLQAAAVTGVLAGGWLSDRVAQGGLRRRMLSQASFYLFAAPFLLTFAGSPSYALISGSIFSFALLRAVGQANEIPTTCDLLPGGLRSTAIALMNTANCFAGGIGSLLAGILKQDYGLGGVFSGVSVIMVVASLLLFAGYRLFLQRDLARATAR
ncbi:MAG: MFS transporter [Acidobacteria bacterium]|nr:MFS transporter [Acidobacteriota bacterium]